MRGMPSDASGQPKTNGGHVAMTAWAMLALILNGAISVMGRKRG